MNTIVKEINDDHTFSWDEDDGKELCHFNRDQMFNIHLSR